MLSAWPDGSVRARFDSAPAAALALGPVWVIDEVSGRRYAVGASARVEEETLVVEEAGTRVASVALALVDHYETVLVPRADGRARSGIWSECVPGAQVVLVWIRSGDWD